MFLLSSSVTNLDIQRLQSAHRIPGIWNLERHHSTAIIWLEGPFTISRKYSDKLLIMMKRPDDDKPICSLEWHFRLGELTVRRRWSGEFCPYIVKSPILTITSHLKLAALASVEFPHGVKPIPPGSVIRIHLDKPQTFRTKPGAKLTAPYRRTYEQTVFRVRELIYASIKRLPNSAALLLSGGLDSAIIAAVAHDIGKPLPAFVFSLKRPVREQRPEENDLLCARKVAHHLNIPCNEVLLAPKEIIKNVPLAVFLAETSRGTIIDPCTALIEVAKRVAEAGFTKVVIGEAADDLFGSFKFALKYRKGQELRAYYRTELDVGLPDEMAILQKVFEPWGIAMIDPFWTAELKEIGYNIPLSFRVDPKRLMKRILRDAFTDLLPEETVRRPKVVTRNGSQVRYILEKEFGTSRERYRPIFLRVFATGSAWQKNLLRPKNWRH